MKHKKLFMLVVLSIVCLAITGCGSEDANNVITPVKIEVENPVLDEETIAQNRVVELFADCWAAYEKDGLRADFNYKEIEDIYKKHPNNKVIYNLYHFCTAIGRYDIYYILEEDLECIDNAKEEAAKIESDYAGPYAEEIKGFAMEVLGSEYNKLSGEAKQRENNYLNLTEQDKKDIINYIYEHEDMDSDELWTEVARMYGISEVHVTYVYTNVDILKQVGAENAAKKQTEEYDSVKVYDGILNFNNGKVVIAASKDALDDALTATANNDEEALGELFLQSKVAFVESGCKVNIIETKTGVMKVEILTGTYKGNVVWVLREEVQLK